MVGKNGQGLCSVYGRDHGYLLCRKVVELSPEAQNGAPDDSGSQIYSHKYRVSEYAISCINICAVSRGAVSGQVYPTKLPVCLLYVLYKVFVLLRDKILSCARRDCLSHRIRMFVVIWATLLFAVRSNNADPGIVCGYITTLLFDQNVSLLLLLLFFSSIRNVKKIALKKRPFKLQVQM